MKKGIPLSTILRPISINIDNAPKYGDTISQIERVRQLLITVRPPSRETIKTNN